jgi:glycosyltransferase involved in cell wall biosynthesis
VRERRVLHVLPHAGGGGDTYVDVLDHMPGYTFTRLHLAPKRKSGVAGSGIVAVAREVRGHDLVHVHGEGAAALLLPLLAIRPSVVTLHGLHLLRRVTGWRRRLASLNLRAVVRAADRTICVSHAEHDVLTAAAGRTRRLIVVHNGVRVAPDAEPAHVDLPAPVGIWVGSLDERRDPVAVVRAAERAGTSLLVVGDGALRPAVERVAGSHVRVLGQRADVPSLLAAADFFVLMSEREGLSFALLEAMAHGLPAIVADIPENLEAIGESGIAVPYAHEEAIATAMRRLADDEERLTLAERARQRTADLFSADVMIARTREVYDEALAELKPYPRRRSRSV